MYPLKRQTRIAKIIRDLASQDDLECSASPCGDWYGFSSMPAILAPSQANSASEFAWLGTSRSRTSCRTRRVNLFMVHSGGRFWNSRGVGGPLELLHFRTALSPPTLPGPPADADGRRDSVGCGVRLRRLAGEDR